MTFDVARIRSSRLLLVQLLILINLLVGLGEAGAEQLTWAKGSAPYVGKDLTGRPCTGNAGGFGPFSYRYRNQLKSELNMVETHHFTPSVESLTRGQSSSVLDDLDYTLRAWPNHHRALYSRIKWFFVKGPPDRKATNRFPRVECYLQRAINFDPIDPVPYMLFGLLVHRADKPELAERLYNRSIELNPNYAEAHYNLGLLLVDLGRYDEAKTQAQMAYKLGHPLPGLKNRLKRAMQAAAKSAPAEAPAETLQLPQ